MIKTRHVMAQMQLVANISPRMPGFNSLSLCVGEQLELGDVFLKVLRFSSVVIILQLLRAHLFNRHLRCTILAADSHIKIHTFADDDKDEADVLRSTESDRHTVVLPASSSWTHPHHPHHPLHIDYKKKSAGEGVLGSVRCTF